MRQYGYAETLIHQLAHRKLLEDLLSIQRRFESASLMLTLQSLKDWLIKHVTESDRRLGEALIVAGMKSSHDGLRRGADFTASGREVAHLAG